MIIHLERESYDNPFMIVVLCFEGSFEIEFLIYKPRVYGVAIGIKNDWWVVIDFSTVTGFKSLTNY